MNDPVLKAAKKEKLDFSGMSHAEITASLKAVTPTPGKVKALERVQSLAKDLLGEENAEAIKKLASRLDNDPVFTSACKRT